MYKIKISTDFSTTPGARHREEGPYPGDEFRDSILIPKYKAAVENKQNLVVDFDGCYGYATSFLEESFGGMVRKLRQRGILDHIELISNEDSSIVELVKQYVKEAEDIL